MKSSASEVERADRERGAGELVENNIRAWWRKESRRRRFALA